MPRRQAKRIRRELTPEETRRWQQARDEAERDREAILARGRRIKAARDRVQAAVRDAFRVLRDERMARGMSLADLEERTGIGKAALSRLENRADVNPTVLTLSRYAQALGMKLVVRFE